MKAGSLKLFWQALSLGLLAGMRTIPKDNTGPKPKTRSLPMDLTVWFGI